MSAQGRVDELKFAVDEHGLTHCSWVFARKIDGMQIAVCSSIDNVVKVTLVEPAPLTCFRCIDIVEQFW